MGYSPGIGRGCSDSGFCDRGISGCGTAHDGARFGGTYDGSHSHWLVRKCKKEGRLVEVGQGTIRHRFSQRSFHNEGIILHLSHFSLEPCRRTKVPWHLGTNET